MKKIYPFLTFEDTINLNSSLYLYENKNKLKKNLKSLIKNYLIFNKKKLIEKDINLKWINFFWENNIIVD